MADPISGSSQPLKPDLPELESERLEGIRFPGISADAIRSSADAGLCAVGERLQQSQGRLARLVAQTKALNQVNRVFHAFLPAHLHEHALLVASGTDAWVVQTDSSAWATRLRYVLPTLHKQMSEHLGREVPPLRIRIIPPAVDTPPAAPVRRLKVTERTADLLQGTAQSISDPGLKAALSRLARHAQERSKA